MQNLDKDRKFLTEGGVFTDDQIDAYIELKFQEIYNFEHTLILLNLNVLQWLDLKRLSTTTTFCPLGF